MSKRQFGTVRHLPSGRWQASYREGRDVVKTPPNLDQSHTLAKHGGG